MATFAWLDFSEADRRKALDVIDLFREKGTVDELGIGTIRDAIADVLFPGTSTIMTRAKYYLFVPWIYLRHEKKKTPSSEIAQKARLDEIALIEALLAGGDKQGVIGVDARANLKRLPSTIYWQSLGVLGIRRYQKSIDHYHRALDSFYRKGDDVLRGDDKHVVTGGNLRRWDPSLPSAPEGFPKAPITLAMSPDNANYLRERVIQAAPHSLFAYLVNTDYDSADFVHIWDHPGHSDFTQLNKQQLLHARNFAEAMHGAALMYNLMLARKNKDEERTEEYETLFADWSGEIDVRQPVLTYWKREDFWKMVLQNGARVPQPTRAFVEHWLGKVIGQKVGRLAEDNQTQKFIQAREKALKGSLSRLDSSRSLNWGGASSSTRLDYRWNRPVRAILADIRAPLD
jgi:hypothetical protein